MQKTTDIANLDRVHPAIMNTVVRGKSGAKPQQRAECCTKGCKRSISITLNDNKLKPFKAFRACAEQRGWAFLPSVERFICPDHKELAMPVTSDTAPREMTRENRRSIFREIDESYDRNGYVFDVSDQSIADKLAMPRAWVTKVREENFGPAGPDPKLKAMAEKIEAAEKKAQLAYDDALSCAEKADKAVAEARALKDQLLALLKA